MVPGRFFISITNVKKGEESCPFPAPNWVRFFKSEPVQIADHKSALFFYPHPARLRLGSFFQISLDRWLRSAKSPRSQKAPSNWVRFFNSPPQPALGTEVWVRFFKSPSLFGFEAQNRHPSTRPLPIGFVFSKPPHQLASKRKHLRSFICRAASARAVGTTMVISHASSPSSNQ